MEKEDMRFEEKYGGMDPRSYLKKAEASMTQRVIEACNDLHSTGRSVSAGLGK